MTQNVREKVKDVLKYESMEPIKIISEGEEIYVVRHKESRILFTKELYDDVIGEIQKEKQ